MSCDFSKNATDKHQQNHADMQVVMGAEPDLNNRTNPNMILKNVVLV